MKQLLSLGELERDQVVDLVALAKRLETKPEPAALAGRILGLLFLDPSLRTLASMQAAMSRLGGESFVVSAGAGSWKLETRPGAVMDFYGIYSHGRLLTHIDALSHLGVRNIDMPASPQRVWRAINDASSVSTS